MYRPTSQNGDIGFPRHVHFIGIGGIGMSALAKLLLAHGCRVSGSDTKSSDVTREIAGLGAEVHTGQAAQKLPTSAALVIFSAAIRAQDPQLLEARRRGLPVMKYAEALGRLTRGRCAVAVSGTHGKTTTTAMIGTALSRIGFDPSVIVGGRVPLFRSNCRVGESDLLVFEACEYDRSFLNTDPRVAVITNVDRDHLDYYGHIDAIEEAFGQFCARVSSDGLAVVNGDDPRALKAARCARCRVETYGAGPSVDWRVTAWQREAGLTRFELSHRGQAAETFVLRPPGFYNVCNAAAAVAVCRHLGAPMADLREALAAYEPADRRFQHLAQVNGVTVLDDYAHHPTEVRVTLDAARQEWPGRRLVCVFQPHQCSRTRLLLDAFAHAFGAADVVLVPEIYAVRDSAADRRRVGSADLVRRLAECGGHAECVSSFEHAAQRAQECVGPAGAVITMGAGPVDEVADLLIGRLQATTAQEAA